VQRALGAPSPHALRHVRPEPLVKAESDPVQFLGRQGGRKRFHGAPDLGEPVPEGAGDIGPGAGGRASERCRGCGRHPASIVGWGGAVDTIGRLSLADRSVEVGRPVSCPGYVARLAEAPARQWHILKPP